MKTRYLIALSAAAVLAGGNARGADPASGWDAYNNGDYASAYTLFLEAFREDPSNVEVNYALGEAASRNKKYSHAVFAYERVLMAEPGHEKALLGKAKALLALGQLEEAQAAFAAVGIMTTSELRRSEAAAGLQAIGSSLPRFTLKGKVFVSGVYDDNINYGDDDNLVPGLKSKKTGGLEGGVDLHAAYDIGTHKNWLAIGGVNLFDSWYEATSEQEMTSLRGYAGARRSRRKSVFEIVGRAERLWYGNEALVDVFGGDMAFMHSLSSADWLITSATLEQRDYDRGFDPAGNRDAVYARLGETWKHYFSNRNTYVGLGGDLLLEDADNDINSYFGYRIRLDGQLELPGAVIGYAGGRYRTVKYDDPDFGLTDEREDDRWDVFIGARRQLTEQLTLDLQYLHIRNDSNTALNDYDRNRLNLTATFEF